MTIVIVAWVTIGLAWFLSQLDYTLIKHIGIAPIVLIILPLCIFAGPIPFVAELFED